MSPGSPFASRPRSAIPRSRSHPAAASNLVVRPCRIEDAPALVDLCEQLGNPSTEAQVRERLLRQQADPSYVALIATDQRGLGLGLLSGHVVFHLEQEPSAQLLALVVDRRSRGQGVSGALMDAFDGWARAAGARRAVVSSGDHRRGSHRGYEQYDFEPDGVRYIKAY